MGKAKGWGEGSDEVGDPLRDLVVIQSLMGGPKDEETEGRGESGEGREECSGTTVYLFGPAREQSITVLNVVPVVLLELTMLPGPQWTE